jgi:hypothetical protein
MWRFDPGTKLSFKDEGLTCDDERQILGWCRQFGLLGILPHVARIIDLPLRFSPHVGKGLYFERQNVLVNGKWIRYISGNIHRSCAPYLKKRTNSFEQDLDLLKAEDPVFGPFVSTRNRLYKAPRVKYFVRAQTALAPQFCDVPADQILPKFFPESNAFSHRFECPLPLTKEFWSIYAEPVPHFLENAMLLLEAVEPVLSHRDSASLAHLGWLLEPVGVILLRDSEGQVREQGACPSLLSAFARMALEDISEGRRLVACECCGTRFLTDSYRARYCSERCGWRHRKRRALTRPDNGTKRHRWQKNG